MQFTHSNRIALSIRNDILIINFIIVIDVNKSHISLTISRQINTHSHMTIYHTISDYLHIIPCIFIARRVHICNLHIVIL